MRNIDLVKGICPICKEEISESWAGRNPTLGVTCETCPDTVFAHEHIRFNAKIEYNPLGRCYKIDWAGTSLKVNNMEGEIRSVAGNWSSVYFHELDEIVHISIGHWDLLKLFEESVSNRRLLR